MVIKISAETGNLQTEMAKVKAQLEKVGSTAKVEAGHTREMGDAFKEVAKRAVEFLAIREVVKFVAESGKAAVENSKSFELMALTLKNSTGASREQSKAVDEQIGALARSAGVMDDKIRPSFDVLVRSTKDSTSALALQKLALDVSAGTGRDLQSVTLAMSKAYEGNTGALARLVPAVKGATDPMGELQKMFSGAAATAANADPYQRLSVAMDQIKEAVGSALLPVLQDLASWMTDAVPQIQAFFTALSDPTTKLGAQFAQLTGIIEGAFNFITSNIGTIIQFGLAFGAVAGAIALVQGAITVYTTVMEIATTAQALFDVALGAFDPAALAIGVGVLAAGVVAIGAGAMAAASSVAGLTAQMQNLNAQSGDFTTNFENSQKAMSAVGPKFGYSADNLDVLIKQYELLGRSNFLQDLGGSKDPGAANALAAVDAYYKQRSALSQANSKTEATQTFDFNKAAHDAQAKADKLALDQKNKAAAAAAQAHADKLKAIADKHHADILKAQQSMADKLAGIIGKSLQSLRDAFTQAAQVDIGSMFATMQEQGDTSADSLLASLKDKLSKIQQLARDTASLAGAGFSELFIQQVVALGPEAGDAMAQSILGASSKTQADLKTTYAQAQQLGSGSFIQSSKTSLSSKELLALGSTSGGQSVVGSSSTVTINAPVSVQTNASPALIAQATVSAIKFGVPLGSF